MKFLWKLRILWVLGLISFVLIVIPTNETNAHEPPWDKHLYWYNPAGYYSEMDIYLDSVDSWWYDVTHAHQKFKFGRSTVIDSQLEYFRIYDQTDTIIYEYKGPVKTSDYDNEMNPNKKVYKGDNLFRMRVKNKDITTANGYLETYYWYESTYWQNVK